MELLPREYFMWFCLLSIGVFGFFISTDLFTMFMFYEIALIPMYLLIGVWGTGKKEYAAMKLTLMLMGGSALLLVGILGIYFNSGATSMNILDIARQHIPDELQRWFFPLSAHSGVDASRRRADETGRLRLFPGGHLPYARSS